MVTKKVSKLKPLDRIRWKKHGMYYGGEIATLERDKQLTYVTFTNSTHGAWCFSNDDELEIVE